MIDEEKALKLVEIALSGQHSVVTYIQSYTEFLAAKMGSKSLKALIKLFKKRQKTAVAKFKRNCRKQTGLERTKSLFLINQLAICVEYYTIEKNNIDEKITVYRNYLSHPEDFAVGGGI